MRLLLDSNTCIQHLRGRSPTITHRLTSLPLGDLAICSVVRAELRYGALRHRDPGTELARLHRFIDPIQSLPFDDAAADHAAHIRAHLAAAGTLIGPHDIQIAAIALAHSLTLVTHNTNEFRRVPALSVEDWQTENDET